MEKKVLTPDEINKKIYDKIFLKAKVSDNSIKRDSITLKSDFKGDLGLDSLDLVELVNEFEKEFGVTVSDMELEKISKVGDAVTLINSKLS